MGAGHAWCVLAALALPAIRAAAEVVTLRNGDRITGSIVSETPRTVRLQTPYGRLAIAKSKIEMIRRADGTEEVLNPHDGPSPSPALSPVALPTARLVLVVTGKTFWRAWESRDAPADPALRMEVRLDEETVAAYEDARLDPGEMPGTVVNSFSFAPEDVRVVARPGSEPRVPEARPGRVVLRIDMLGAAGENRRLRVAYQVNMGTAPEPSWRDAAQGELAVALRADVPTFVQVRQDRGKMEFAGFPRKKMKNTETFGIELVAE